MTVYGQLSITVCNAAPLIRAPSASAGLSTGRSRSRLRKNGAYTRTVFYIATETTPCASPPGAASSNRYWDKKTQTEHCPNIAFRVG